MHARWLVGRGFGALAAPLLASVALTETGPGAAVAS
jgi:hypothetical protein